MKTLKIILSIVMLSLIAIAGGYIYFTNTTFKNSVDDIFKSEPTSVQLTQAPAHNAVFVIVDGSGSGRSTYSVPKIDTTYIRSLITKIHENGSGDLWLTYIDMEAMNNKVLHMTVPQAPEKPIEPERAAGESRSIFHERELQHEEALAEYRKKEEQYRQTLMRRTKAFLDDAQSMIEVAYGPKKPGEDYSDVVGSVNSGIRALSSIQSNSTQLRTILLISDGIQDLPSGKASKELKEIPSDIQVITVNHSGSENNIVSGRTVELATLDQAAEVSIQTSKNGPAP